MKIQDPLFEVKPKRNLFFIAIGASVLLLLLVIFLLFHAESLKVKLDQTHFLLSKTEASVEQLQKDKAAILKDNEKLQVDTLSYVALNNELQQEKEALQKKLEEVQKAIEMQKQELGKVQQNLDDIQKTSQDKSKAQQDLVKERDKILSDLKDMEKSVNRERGIYHYNLAVAYTKAMLINQAVQEYAKSLEYDPQNADAHYNLGTLYKKIGDDPAKALLHFRKYLELKAGAEDAQEVRDLINQLVELSKQKLSSL